MKKNFKIIMGICFTIYLMLLFYLTIFGRIENLHFIWENGRFDYYIKNNFNIVPFQSIFFILKHLSIKQIFLNIIGNILAFIPFGFFLPYFKKKIKPMNFFSLMIVFSFAIEVTQMIIQSGSFDIDDIILNVLGSFIGYFTMTILCSKQTIQSIFEIKTRNRNIQKLFLILFICFAIFGSIICFIIYNKKEKSIDNRLYLVNKIHKE